MLGLDKLFKKGMNVNMHITPSDAVNVETETDIPNETVEAVSTMAMINRRIDEITSDPIFWGGAVVLASAAVGIGIGFAVGHHKGYVKGYQAGSLEGRALGESLVGKSIVNSLNAYQVAIPDAMRTDIQMGRVPFLKIAGTI